MKTLSLTNEYISSFCLQIALLIHAGISLSDGVQLLADDEQEELKKTMLLHLVESLDEGMQLSEAMEAVECFPVYVIRMTKAGENTGRTEQAFRSMADYYESQRQLWSRIRGALVYPAILMVLMLIIIGVLLIKILPVFHQVYEQLGGHMDGLAGGLLKAGQGLEKSLPVIAIVLAFGLILTVGLRCNTVLRAKFIGFLIRHTEGWRIAKKVSASRFAAALAMGLRSGLVTEDALDLAASFQKEEPKAAERCERCRKLIQEGNSLAEALKESDLLEPMHCRMLALGSKSGTADSVMEEIAHRLDEDSQLEIEKTVGRVEPTIVIITSLLVGVILLAVMLPLMDIMASIG